MVYIDTAELCSWIFNLLYNCVATIAKLCLVVVIRVNFAGFLMYFKPPHENVILTYYLILSFANATGSTANELLQDREWKYCSSEGLGKKRGWML